MQISANTTGMVAELAVVTDKDARDHCVVAVKGTFRTNAKGELTLHEEQRPLVTADEHYGDPATTSMRYECDFALRKSLTDVLVVGKAVAPNGQRVKDLPVALEVQGKRKSVLVHGDRAWVSALGMLGPSDPVAFTELPLTYERAWGGMDDSRGETKVDLEPRNPVGVGFHPHRSNSQVVGRPVPNLELAERAVTSPRERHEPVGFGCIGRAWKPRLELAGTYDAKWRDECAPYLPADFDERFFQCAPRDQQFPLFRGGERIRCLHMAEQEVVTYVMPGLDVPLTFRFVDGDVRRQAVLDTVTLEPHLGIAMLVYRASVPLRKKLPALREILVGQPKVEHAPEQAIVGYRNGKPVIAGVGATIHWLHHRRGKR
jgi:hypothetical protein